MFKPNRIQSALTMLATGRTGVVACAMAFASIASSAAPVEQHSIPQQGSTPCSARGSIAGVELDCPAATLAALLAALHAATGLQSEYPVELGSARVSVLRRRAPLFDVLDNALAGFNFVVSTDAEPPHLARVNIVGMRAAQTAAPERVPQSLAAPRDVARAVPSASSADPEGSTNGNPPPPGTRGSGPHPANDELEQRRVREDFEDSVVQGTPHPPPASEPGSVMVPTDSSEAESMPVTVTR